MKTEYEVRILEINVNEIFNKLESLGAVKIGEFNQKRFTYDFTPVKNNSWIRLRTNGEKSTLTIKEILSNQVDGTKELEIEVDDFDKTDEILNKLGYSPRNYQENKRISFKIDEVEVEIDSWPMIPTYLEIEGKSKEEVKFVVEKLGFKMEDTTGLNTSDIYKEKYGIDVLKIKELKFEN